MGIPVEIEMIVEVAPAAVRKAAHRTTRKTTAGKTTARARRH
jgi:hypothetical protein